MRHAPPVSKVGFAQVALPTFLLFYPICEGKPYTECDEIPCRMISVADKEDITVCHIDVGHTRGS